MLNRSQIKASTVAELALALAIGSVTESLIKEVLGENILAEVISFGVSDLATEALGDGVAEFLDDLF